MKRNFINIIFLFFFTIHFLPAQNLDFRILNSINHHESKCADKSFLFLTNTATPVGIINPVAILTSGYISNDHSLIRKGYVSAASAILSVALSTTLKHTFKRPRPFIQYPEIHRKAQANDPSFPSGHTTIAFATAMSLSLSFPKTYVIIPAFLWASAISYSRMYLGVHFPSDILGGIVIGVGASVLCYEMEKVLKYK